jgi:hypothetical protein
VSGVHVYCIAPASYRPPADLHGLDGAVVHSHDSGQLAVWYTDHAAPPVASIEHVRAHDAVVRAAMTTDITPVPVRFGQWFEDAAGAAAQVAAQADHWSALLRQFATRAEYGVRVIPLDDESQRARDVHPPPAPSGRAYMEALAERQAEAERMRGTAEAFAAAVTARLQDVIADSRVELRPDARTIATIAHLVAWRDAEAYHSRMRAIRDAHTELRLLFTGPWPPYSFVS